MSPPADLNPEIGVQGAPPRLPWLLVPVEVDASSQLGQVPVCVCVVISVCIRVRVYVYAYMCMYVYMCVCVRLCVTCNMCVSMCIIYVCVPTLLIIPAAGGWWGHGGRRS